MNDPNNIQPHTYIICNYTYMPESICHQCGHDPGTYKVDKFCVGESKDPYKFPYYEEAVVMCQKLNFSLEKGTVIMLEHDFKSAMHFPEIVAAFMQAIVVNQIHMAMMMEGTK